MALWQAAATAHLMLASSTTTAMPGQPAVVVTATGMQSHQLQRQTGTQSGVDLSERVQGFCGSVAARIH